MMLIMLSLVVCLNEHSNHGRLTKESVLKQIEICRAAIEGNEDEG